MDQKSRTQACCPGRWETRQRALCSHFTGCRRRGRLAHQDGRRGRWPSPSRPDPMCSTGQQTRCGRAARTPPAGRPGWLWGQQAGLPHPDKWPLIGRVPGGQRGALGFPGIAETRTPPGLLNAGDFSAALAPCPAWQWEVGGAGSIAPPPSLLTCPLYHGPRGQAHPGWPISASRSRGCPRG